MEIIKIACFFCKHKDCINMEEMPGYCICEECKENEKKSNKKGGKNG